MRMQEEFAWGYIKVENNHLEDLKRAFLSEGFHLPIFQEWKPGQLWGAVKRIDKHNEVHVRIIHVFDGFQYFLIVDPEVEVPREYIEHLWPEFSAQPFYGYIKQVLSKSSVPYTVVGDLPSDPISVTRPMNPLPWWKLVTCILSAAGLALLVGRAWRQASNQPASG
jgi:hypothetical protein